VANYRSVSPVGQMDNMACWAACLAWWLKALGDRPRWSQTDMFKQFDDLTDDDGGLNVNAFIDAVNNMPGLKLTAALFPTNRYRGGRLPIGERPVLIGFRPPDDTGTAPNNIHMNVVLSQSSGKVTAMEPYYPFPGQDFKRTGTFLTRNLGFYIDNAPDVMLGWAND
jgi:hypothetical protein